MKNCSVDLCLCTGQSYRMVLYYFLLDNGHIIVFGLINVQVAKKVKYPFMLNGLLSLIYFVYNWQ